MLGDRTVASLVALGGVAVVSLGLWALTPGPAPESESLQAAQRRFLDSQTILWQARDNLPLSEELREELREVDRDRTGYIGLPWTPMTSTEGSLAAKRSSTDPRWVVRIAAMIDQCAGETRSPTVWIAASGSFPALAVGTLLACEAEGARAHIVPSLAASTHGANVPGFDLLAMLETLREAGVIDPSLHTIPGASVGGENDRGVGLAPEAVHQLRRAITSHQAVEFIDELSIEEAVNLRFALWREASGAEWPDLFINIGGGQAAVGPASEVLSLRPGVNLPSAGGGGEGVARRMLAQGVPVIHLLNLEQIAAQPMPTESGEPRGREWARRGIALLGLLLLTLWTAWRLKPNTLLNTPPVTMNEQGVTHP